MELPSYYLPDMGISVPMDKDDPDLPDYEAAMTLYISKSGGFRMFWD